MPDIRIKSLHNEEFGAYCAVPPSGNGPGLVVIQEIFGVNASLRKICDDFAKKGMIAVCPDLFWRLKPGLQLDPGKPAERDEGFGLFKKFDVEAGVRDLLATLAHVRAMKGCSGKVGAVGYCLGGKLAYLMAARSDVDATVSYYGVGLETMLGEILDIRMPVILHIAALDKYLPEAARQKVLKAAAKNPVIAPYVYEGVDHAFARPNGDNYNETAAKLANERTDKFFAEYLKA